MSEGFTKAGNDVKFFQEKKLRMICIGPLSLEGPAVSLPSSKATIKTSH